jgi:tetratricopeptide (TPR) repeat protein
VTALGLDHVQWLVVTVIVVGLVVATPAKIVTTRWEARAQRAEDRRHTLTDGAVGGGRRRVRDLVDPTALGVHPAVLGPAGHGRAPEYVRRDQHEAVVTRLVPGRFVVIQGDSGAGKSRLAFEAARAAVGQHVVFAPEPPALDAAIAQMREESDAVLWLDDLDRYLEVDTFSATQLTELLAGEHHQRMVLATLRHQAREFVLSGADGPEHSTVDRQRRILALADFVLIHRQFTPTELDRARQQRSDPRIADALAHADRYGVAEYLAAGPQLRDKWVAGQESHPRGAALVAAAVDCRRGGYAATLPKALLDEVHTHYLPDNPRVRVEDLAAAWTWATERWQRTSALLEPLTDGDTVIVFDYLLDHVQRTTPDDDPPDEVLRVAITHANATTAAAIGEHAYGRERYELAYTAHTRAMSLRADKEHPSALIARSNRGTALWSLGRLDEAEREHREVLAARTRLLGAGDQKTLTSRGNLAITLRSLGRLTEAEQEHREVLAARTRLLGADHQKTLLSRTNHAVTLSALGRLDEAEHAHRAVLAARVRALGADHADTLTSRSNLASVLSAQGRPAEAEREYREVLAARTRLLGADHPDTLTSRGNVASALSTLGRPEAEPELRAVLTARTRVLGAEHPDTVLSRSSLAFTLWQSGRLTEAEREYREVLAARTRLLGADHPQTLACRSNLARVRSTLGRPDAEAELRAVLTARTRVLGAEHPDTVLSRSILAFALRRSGQLAEAEREYRTVSAVRTRLLGAEHPQTLTSRNNLATVLSELGRSAEAEPELRTVLAARTRVLGAEHPDTVLTRGCLAAALRQLGRLAEAVSEYRDVVDTRTRILGEAHSTTVASRKALAATMAAQAEKREQNGG